jgi:hypothetical protein
MGAFSLVYGVGNRVCIGDVSQQSASKQSLSRAVSFSFWEFLRITYLTLGLSSPLLCPLFLAS